ncbi:potassium uptake system protein, partial [candidate division bacterium WOR-3 4484_18]
MKRFCVIGLGKFGISVAKALSRKGAEVLAIDTDEERVNEASNFATQAIILDATDKEALQRIGIQDIDAAIVAVGKDMASSILITSLLKELGVKYVVAKALSPLHGKVLEKVGADRVVFPERDMGMRV